MPGGTPDPPRRPARFVSEQKLGPGRLASPFGRPGYRSSAPPESPGRARLGPAGGALHSRQRASVAARCYPPCTRACHAETTRSDGARSPPPDSRRHVGALATRATRWRASRLVVYPAAPRPQPGSVQRFTECSPYGGSPVAMSAATISRRASTAPCTSCSSPARACANQLEVTPELFRPLAASSPASIPNFSCSIWACCS